MQRTSRRKPQPVQPKSTQGDAIRQGLIDGRQWAETQAHPAELSQIGYWFEVNCRRGKGTSFRYRGRFTGEQEFLAMIRPQLDEQELPQAARDFWGDRHEVIVGFGRFGLHYLKEFSDAALTVWLSIKESWQSVSYARGVEAGQRWSRNDATPEELKLLITANMANGSGYRGKIYWPNIDDPYRIAEAVLAPEPDGNEEDYDPEERTRLVKKFWEPIIGQPFEIHRFKLLERRFVIGFMDGALDKTDIIWSRF
jgi:voltage-gated potassium channel Kch